jgi:uncharacterized protein YhbP (UPF0306 family)
LIDESIIEFINNHHLLSLSTCKDNLPWSASCFYAFDKNNFVFVIASDEKTLHVKNLLINPNYSALIALETKEVGKIQGLQFRGVINKSSSKEKALYLKTYPYAIALNPTLWTLSVEYLKFTNNKLGFGKKLEYKRSEGAKLAPIN